MKNDRNYTHKNIFSYAAPPQKYEKISEIFIFSQKYRTFYRGFLQNVIAKAAWYEMFKIEEMSDETLSEC